MTWNHRVIAKQYDHFGTTDYYYDIHEVHYDRNNKPTSWTEDPTSPSGETIEEIKWALEHMLKCLEKPILIEHENKLIEFKL